MSADLGRPVETFRGSARPMARVGLALGGFIAVLMLGRLLLENGGVSLVDLGVALGIAAGGAALMAAFGLLIMTIWTVKVGPRGIAACTYWGWPAHARWEEITAVDIVDVQGVPYLVLHRTGRRGPLYAYADLRDGERFDALVASYVGPEHPLFERVASDEAWAAAFPDG